MSYLLPSGHLDVINNQLHIGNIPCSEIAKDYGTPTYVYNLHRVKENYRRLRGSLTHHSPVNVKVYYAVKANYNPSILKTLESEGANAEVVSSMEAKLALNLGYISDRILFTGTSVSDETMRYLLNENILINIDSFSQMRRLAKFAPDGLQVSVRWNPGEGAGFNPKAITAGAESHGRPIKFGIEESKVLELCKEALELGLRPIGLHQHIGSGWTGDEVNHFLDTVDATFDMAIKMSKVLGYSLDIVDLGGGPGIPYEPEQPKFPVDEYGIGICDRLNESGLDIKTICVESGKYIVGDSGVLLTSVNTVEEKNRNLIIGVDAGFNTLIRPAFYGNTEKNVFKETYHHVIVADRVKGSEAICTIAGPLCETGDLFAIKRNMTVPKEGETLAILGAGAYGYSMASVYNLQPRPAEVTIPGPLLTTRREEYSDLIHLFSQNYI